MGYILLYGGAIILATATADLNIWQKGWVLFGIISSLVGILLLYA